MALSKQEKALLKKLLLQLEPEDREAIVGTPEPTLNQGKTNIPLGKRPNLFETSTDFKKFKADSKTDRLLWGKNKPEERLVAIKVTAECTQCGKKEKVNPIFAYEDLDEKKVYFTCDKCTKVK